MSTKHENCFTVSIDLLYNLGYISKADDKEKIISDNLNPIIKIIDDGFLGVRKFEKKCNLCTKCYKDYECLHYEFHFCNRYYDPIKLNSFLKKNIKNLGKVKVEMRFDN